jgi:AsmA-like C-terminal region
MRRRVVIVGLLAATVAAVIYAVYVVWDLRPQRIEQRIIAALIDRFDSNVTVGSADIAVFPRLTASGTDLTFRYQGRTDVPPLVTIPSFAASAPISGALGSRLRLASVRLEGLQIYMPPDRLKSVDGGSGRPQLKGKIPDLYVDEIVSRAARLEIASKKPGRLPRVFEIHDLVMNDFSSRGAAKFQAGVTNPIPRGRVETNGSFGPWQADEPRLTPISGQYSFTGANLDDIKGIGGILSSVGSYRGTLERIEVQGQTETPQFSIDIGGQPVPLSTKFKAIVDGTNGDTWLERVDAILGQSPIVASGAIVRTEDVKGRRVTLDVQLNQARIEDVMRLAVKSNKPPLSGRVDLTTAFLLPQGDEDVINRLRLNGRFNLAEARFANVDVQKRLTALSLKARGKEEGDPETEGASIVSRLRGKFALRHAVLEFEELTFAVPGAMVQLEGTYTLHDEQLNFHGDLMVDASLADMTTGFRSLLARLAQPFFRRKGGGTQLPIKITGPRSKPEFGLDVGRVFRRG